MELDIPRDRLSAFLRGMPKAELHVHVEGTIEPEHALAIARRGGVELGEDEVAAVRDATPFTGLQSFLDRYYAAMKVLRTEEDFHDLAAAYLERAQQDGVVRAEIFFDPQAHTARGVSVGTVVRGLSRACDEARATGIDASLLLSFLRHLPEQDAFAVLEEAMPFRDRFIGVGLDSSEKGNPPEKFARVFARCRDLGLHVVAHAGEEGPPEYVAACLDVLGVERIDHGVRSMEAPALVARLARDRVPLTVCPLSNVRLRVVPSLAHHPIGRMLDAGLVATVNSDDPAYFGGYLHQNLLELFGALPLDGNAAYRLARNGLEASFASPAEKRRLVDRLDAFTAEFTGS